jgi:DNA phosphorothioation-dependent restriction protein DptG
MHLKPLLSVLVPAAATLALAACGSDSSSGSKEAEEHENASPAVALREVGETRDGLNAALSTYKQGDKAAAADQVAETYLQHFEEVEGPLGRKDEELNERLEEGINEHLRDAMKAGKPAAEIEASVEALLADLRKAEAALR